ncbi:3'(2'),5'-bisphosphate nucleotidase CysQ [Polycladidibacter stylochi]|uniref:3'(2'),5'-bisphosphate nucleotidase CysQ n=1 Tax=Polycladidibacter stylochi TaxID=1807766 RepID=UPI00082B6093|nr:3'(2'),5'-bisphosphate nucleotidase CysQ [Pseudovibrio stylochi]
MPGIDQFTKEKDLVLLRNAAIAGGMIAKRYFGENPQSWTKQGNSPVSIADLEVDRFLKDTLLKARPDYGWLSEESEDNPERLKKQRVFVVDPIDGTRAFLFNKSEWCVSVAIVENGRPYAGVVYCPVRDELFTATSQGGAFKNDVPIKVSAKEDVENSLVSGPDRLLSSPKAKAASLQFQPKIGSLAYRFAMVADGRLDAAMAQARASDWDLAAVDLLLAEAGGQLVDAQGNALLYNKSSTNHPELVASPVKLFKRLQGIFRRDEP